MGMPLLGWLRKRPAYEARPDKIWLDGAAALTGIAAAAGTQLDAGESVVVAAYFADVLDELSDALAARIGECRLIDRPLRGGDLVQIAAKGDRLLLAPAELLTFDHGEMQRASKSPPLSVAILVREHHPLRSYDERIEQFAATVPALTSLEFHIALDDPLVRQFAGPWVSRVLSGMGLRRDESVESRMITRKIRASQLKIERRTTALEPAHVAARNSGEWLEKNTL